MKRTFTWSLQRDAGGRGLERIDGTVDAHDCKEAHRLINEEVASYAQSGLIKGEFTVRLRDANRYYAARQVHVHSPFNEDAILNQDVPAKRELWRLLGAEPA